MESPSNSLPHVDILFQAQPADGYSLEFHKDKALPWVLASRIQMHRVYQHRQFMCLDLGSHSSPNIICVLAWSGFRVMETFLSRVPFTKYVAQITCSNFISVLIAVISPSWHCFGFFLHFVEPKKQNTYTLSLCPLDISFKKKKTLRKTLNVDLQFCTVAQVMF